MRFRGKAETVHAQGESDVELRSKLNQLLNAAEPGFLGVIEIFPADKIVVYAVAPENEVLHYRRSYTDESGVNINSRRTEVEPVTEWKPVSAQATPAAAAASCGCNGGKPATSSTTPPEGADAPGEPVMHKHAERITALIASKYTSWREADRSHLETVGDERIREEEQAAATNEERAAAAERERIRKEEEEEEKAKAAGTSPTGAAVPPQSTAVAAARGAIRPATPATEEDPEAWKATAPEHVVKMYEANLQAQAQKRAENIKTLKARLKDNKALVAKLDSKSDEELEDLLSVTATEQTPALGSVIDNSGRFLAGSRQAQREAEDDEHKVPPAPSVTELIRKNRAAAAR